MRCWVSLTVRINKFATSFGSKLDKEVMFEISLSCYAGIILTSRTAGAKSPLMRRKLPSIITQLRHQLQDLPPAQEHDDDEFAAVPRQAHQ